MCAPTAKTLCRQPHARNSAASHLGNVRWERLALFNQSLEQRIAERRIQQQQPGVWRARVQPCLPVRARATEKQAQRSAVTSCRRTPRWRRNRSDTSSVLKSNAWCNAASPAPLPPCLLPGVCEGDVARLLRAVEAVGVAADRLKDGWAWVWRPCARASQGTANCRGGMEASRARVREGSSWDLQARCHAMACNANACKTRRAAVPAGVGARLVSRVGLYTSSTTSGSHDEDEGAGPPPPAPPPAAAPAAMPPPPPAAAGAPAAAAVADAAVL